jgi:hypothetical protein
MMNMDLFYSFFIDIKGVATVSDANSLLGARHGPVISTGNGGPANAIPKQAPMLFREPLGRAPLTHILVQAPAIISAIWASHRALQSAVGGAEIKKSHCWMTNRRAETCLDSLAG